MKVSTTALNGVKLVEPQVFGDSRGYFMESWSAEKYRAEGMDRVWVQDNESSSKFGVLRGLHYQAAPYTQGKLVRVVCGCVLDVILDIRRDSPTFGRHIAIELSGENKRQVFIPRGFAHGFLVLSESAVFTYKCDNVYMPSAERGIAFDDPALGIDWRLSPSEWVLAEKDRHHPKFADAEYLEF